MFSRTHYLSGTVGGFGYAKMNKTRVLQESVGISNKDHGGDRETVGKGFIHGYMREVHGLE